MHTTDNAKILPKKLHKQENQEIFWIGNHDKVWSGSGHKVVLWTITFMSDSTSLSDFMNGKQKGSLRYWEVL